MSAEIDWTPYLDPGEKVVWTGRPRLRIRIYGSDAISGMIGLVFLASTIVVVRDEISAKGETWWAAVPFVLIGAYLLLGRHATIVVRHLTTRYALTNTRAMILRRLLGTRLIEFPITAETPVEVSLGRTGTIWLGQRAAWDRTFAARINGIDPGDFSFLNIPDPDAVHQLIRRIQRGEAA